MKKFLNINDIRICVDDTVEGDNAILLFHGLTNSKEGMYIIRDMLRDDYRVISVDTRGHGESTRPLRYTLDDHARDALEIIKELELEKVNILGYSMGSYIALRIAQMNCENIDHLILLCTKGSGKTSSVARLLKEEGLDITTVTQDEMMQVILKASFSPQTFEKITSGQLDIEDYFNKDEKQELSSEEKKAEDQSIANFNNMDYLDKVTCKTLVVGAEFDGINPPELGKKVAEGIDGAEFKLIRNSGHMVHLEQPKQLNSVIREFLSE